MADEQNANDHKPRALTLIQGGKEAASEALSTKSASEIATELKDRIIPLLEQEKERIWNERLSLGLQESRLPYPYGSPSYPQRSDLKEAYEKAVQIVGGEAFVQAKKQAERLEAMDQKLEKTLSTLDQTNRGILRYSPRYLREKRALENEQRQVRKLFNESVTRYNAKVEYLNSPENQHKIASVAKGIIATETKQEVARHVLDREFSRLEAHLERVYDAKRTLSSLGDVTLSFKQVSVRVGQEKVKIPLPLRVKDYLRPQGPAQTRAINFFQGKRG